MSAADREDPPECLYAEMMCCGRVIMLRNLEPVYIGGRPFARSDDVELALDLHRRGCNP